MAKGERGKGGCVYGERASVGMGGMSPRSEM